MDTILLLFSESRNRLLLQDYLAGKYDVRLSEKADGLDIAFDLCIADGQSLKRLRDAVVSRKAAEKELFLPVLLVTPKKDVGLLTAGIWHAIDEVITSPIQKTMLYARIEVLLRTRRLSAELRGCKEVQLQQARKSLSESEELQKAMIACTPLATYSLDRAGNVLSWNPAAETMFGWQAREVIGRPLPIAPTGKQDGCEALLRRILSGESISGMELVRQRKDGYSLECSLSGAPIRGHQGDIVGVMAAMEDITARKELQLQYKQLFDGMNDSAFVMDFQARFLDVNETAVKTMGYNRTELLDMGAIDIDPYLDSGQIRELVERMQSKRQVFETQHRTKDGKIIPVEVSSSRAVYQGQKAILCIVRDISERKNAEEKQDQLRAQFLQAQKMESVGRLAGGVAHDFNNMLSIVRGYCEMAMDKVQQQDPLYEDLQEILTAARRSTEIARQLLAFARKQTISPSVVDLNETVESMLKMLRRLIGEDIDLAWLPGKQLWLAYIDPSQIDQILANLCVNARDAIDGVGKVTIETGNITFDDAYCEVHPGFLPGEFALITISDNGCGMDEEILKNIFEPFFTTKGVAEGTGLGLATVYGIVKQNAGFINVYSEPENGTIFRIYLPRHVGEESRMIAATKTQTPRSSGEAVLLVEDEPSIMKMAEIMLKHLGYQVLAADTPGRALELAEQNASKIDLLITDVVMPEMSGRDLAGKIHSLCPKIKTLFMSGYTANVIAHNGVLDQGLNYIQKPFSLHDLGIKISSVLKA